MNKWQVASVVALVMGCSGSDGADGKSGVDGNTCSVVETAGAVSLDCSDGSSTTLPGAAASSVIATTDEAAGANCANGGTRVDHGLDANLDGVLDAEEVTGTSYVCNGASGSDGAPGAPGGQGDPGQPGANGTPGADAIQPLVEINPIAAGPECAEGGLSVASGLDADANGTLDSTEVTSTNYVCNGGTGAGGAPGQDGFTTLAATSSEPAGSNCAAGGTKLEFGADLDRSGTLEGTEVTQTTYVCAAASCDDATEVSYGGRCYYLDGAPCQAGYSLASQSVMTNIAGDFLGKDYKSTISGNCCIQHGDQPAIGQYWGMESGQCNNAGPFATIPVLGGSGCVDEQNTSSTQLTFCVSN